MPYYIYLFMSKAILCTGLLFYFLGFFLGRITFMTRITFKIQEILSDQRFDNVILLVGLHFREVDEAQDSIVV